MAPSNLDFHTQLFPHLDNCKLVFFQLDWITQENKNFKQAKEKKKKSSTRLAFVNQIAVFSPSSPCLMWTYSHSLTQAIPAILPAAESLAKMTIIVNWNSETS